MLSVGLRIAIDVSLVSIRFADAPDSIVAGQFEYHQYALHCHGDVVDQASPLLGAKQADFAADRSRA